MKILDSDKIGTDTLDFDFETELILKEIDEDFLKETVESLSYPKHFVAESADNLRAGLQIADAFRSYGYDISINGPRNIMAVHPDCPPGSRILVGSHYDTVPGSPGADDNASAVAVSLACAKALTFCQVPPPVVFVSFNREEDDLMGSREFVQKVLPECNFTIKEAHILEMVGYCSHEPESQSMPAGIPVKTPDVGDFLALVGNKDSNHLIKPILVKGNAYCSDLHTLGLQVHLGLEKVFPHLLRSDHAPFWFAKKPALMWTDTANFRNANYHLESDTPETLDYGFMKQVAQLMLATIMEPRIT